MADFRQDIGGFPSVVLSSRIRTSARGPARPPSVDVGPVRHLLTCHDMPDAQTGGPERKNVGSRKPDSGPQDGKHVRRRQVAFGLSYLLTSLLALWLFQELVLSPLFIQAHEIPYSEFRAKVKAGQVVEITIGVEFLLRAFGELRKGHTDVVLVLVGDGPILDKLKALAHRLALDHAIFVGQVPHRDIAVHYQAADLFVSSSLTDTQASSSSKPSPADSAWWHSKTTRSKGWRLTARTAC
jgi:Glycosyl transferases group 1